MIKFRLFALFFAVLLGVTSVSAQATEQATEASQSNVAITLERTACFGRCPIYTVTILEDGTVLYNGGNFVDVTGEQTGQIDPATVALMVQALDKAGYFGWNESYTHMEVTDLSTVITSVTRDGVTHRITRYQGDRSAPSELPFLEQWIDLMAGTPAWTGAQSDVSALSYNGNSPVVTLQRDPCFGNCPVYSVALFEDGTVVYMGIANVSDIGVRVLKADAFAVDGIAQQAKALGYFDWKAAYQDQVKTDQSTVTTSIYLGDQSQRIVRYDGDPNAPVGLLWIEQSIDQLVTSLTA
jgi:hypothetical protein